MISRDCFGAVHLMILSWFCLQTGSDSPGGNTQDECCSGGSGGARIAELLFGVWLPETVQLWGDDSVQSERLEDLEENITREYNTTVSTHNWFNRFAVK